MLVSNVKTTLGYAQSAKSQVSTVLGILIRMIRRGAGLKPKSNVQAVFTIKIMCVIHVGLIACHVLIRQEFVNSVFQSMKLQAISSIVSRQQVEIGNAQLASTMI